MRKIFLFTTFSLLSSVFITCDPIESNLSASFPQSSAQSSCQTEWNRINQIPNVTDASRLLGYGDGSCSLSACLSGVAPTLDPSSCAAAEISGYNYPCTCTVSYLSQNLTNYFSACHSVGGLVCPIDILSLNLTNTATPPVNVAFSFYNYHYTCIPNSNICPTTDLTKLASDILLGLTLNKLSGFSDASNVDGILNIQLCRQLIINQDNSNYNQIINQLNHYNPNEKYTVAITSDSSMNIQQASKDQDLDFIETSQSEGEESNMNMNAVDPPVIVVSMVFTSESSSIFKFNLLGLNLPILSILLYICHNYLL